MEENSSGRMNFGILVSTLYDLLGSKFLSISLDVRSIVLQTAFLVKLDVWLQKKLQYIYLIVNVFLYCFMDLKPARSVSQI